MHTREHDAAENRHVGRSRALHLRTLDDTRARLGRLVGTGLCAELAIDATVLRIEVSDLRPAASTSDQRPLHLQTSMGSLCLSPAREIVRALTSIDLAGESESDPLHALRVDIAAQSMPSGWLPLFGAAATVIGTEDIPAPLEVTLSIFQPQARLGFVALLRGTSEALLHALTQPAWKAIDNGESETGANWPLQLPLRIGSTVLRMPELKSLEAGDIVPIENARFGPTGEGELHIADSVARGVLHLGNQSQFEVTEWHPTNTEADMNLLHEPDDEQAGHAHEPFDAADTSLDALPVTLIFELGSIELPLSELRDLGPGSVLPLVGARQPHVSIRVGSHRVGAGELVELDGQLAVEIHRIGAPA